MNDIETSMHLGVIDRLLKKHGLSEDSFLLVDDVERWCVDNGIVPEREYRPFRVAKCLYSSEKDKYLILMAKIITTDMVAGTNPVVAMRLGNEYARKLEKPHLFVEHTILHEIGHTKGLSEEGCDEFAFNDINDRET